MDEREVKNVLDAAGVPVQPASPIEQMGWTGKSANVRIVRGVEPTTGAETELLALWDQRQRQYLERRCEHGQ